VSPTLKPYPEYKDSGVPWLGQIPAHWEVSRLKRICRFAYGDSLPSDARQQGDIAVFGSNGRVGFHDAANTRSPCIIIGRKGSFGKVHFVADQVFAIDTTFFVDERFTEANLRWLSYLLGWLGLDEVSKDSAVPGLHREDAYYWFAGYPVDFSEQAAIARYLDYIDRRIQRYIRAQQKLIALLEEEKQAIIQQAVTRGLDPDVPLKPSGIDWLGEIPEHWQVRRLKNLLRCPLANGLFKKKEFFGSGVPLVNVSDIYQDDLCVEPEQLELVRASGSEIRTFRVKPGDIFFVRSSLKLEGTGRSAYVDSCDANTVFECHLVKARPAPSQIQHRYLALYLNSTRTRNYVVSRANTVTMSTLPQHALSGIAVAFSDAGEQQSIIQFIGNRSGPIRAAMHCAQRRIALLREYRTRLISDVVTGKLDVRGAASQLDDVDKIKG